MIKRILCIICFLLSVHTLFSYEIIYKEQYYRLFHNTYRQTSDEILENIYWLERAVKADFCNPQYALAKITTKDDWEKYRYLFMMHINLKLIEQHMRLARIWDKQVAYFYDAPWKEEYLADLETAQKAYRMGLLYWKEAQLWAEKAGEGRFYFMNMQDIQYWEDERTRIANGDLDYNKILTRELQRVQNVIDTFEAMDENTY